MVDPIAAAVSALIFRTLPLDAALMTTVVTPALAPTVAMPAWYVVIPVIVATFTIFGVHFLQYLFVYLSTKTIDIAIALPVDAFVFSSVAISVDPLPTLILMDEYAVKIPAVLIPVADEALILPVTLPVTSPVTPPTTSPVTLPVKAPLNDVAVATPVTTSTGKPTEPLSSYLQYRQLVTLT